MKINLPDVLAEVSAEFERYEQALVSNDVKVLDEQFWNDPLTLRYGIGETLYGWEAIAAFRSARPAAGLARTLENTVITTYGRNTATANTEFVRGEKRGRQSQAWIRFPQGWRIVSAHVSMMG